MGQFDHAVSDFTKVITADSRHNDAYFNRGLALSKLGYHQGAIDDWSYVIDMNSSNWVAYMSRGNSYALLQPPDWMKALADHAKVLAYTTFVHVSTINRYTRIIDMI